MTGKRKDLTAPFTGLFALIVVGQFAWAAAMAKVCEDFLGVVGGPSSLQVSGVLLLIAFVSLLFGCMFGAVAQVVSQITTLSNTGTLWAKPCGLLVAVVSCLAMLLSPGGNWIATVWVAGWAALFISASGLYGLSVLVNRGLLAGKEQEHALTVRMCYDR